MKAINVVSDSVIGDGHGHQQDENEFEIYLSDDDDDNDLLHSDEDLALWINNTNNSGNDNDCVAIDADNDADYGNPYLPHCLVTPPKVRRKREPVETAKDTSTAIGVHGGNIPSRSSSSIDQSQSRACISAVSIFKDTTDAEEADDDEDGMDEGETLDEPTSEVAMPKTFENDNDDDDDVEGSKLEIVVVTPDNTPPKLQIVPSITVCNEVEETFHDIAVSNQLETPHEILDDESASSSDETNICSNCSPATPTNLNESQLGIISGDMVLSILDCPGSRTRKKRALRNHDPTNNIFKWGDHAMSETICRMRHLRKSADNTR